METPIFLRNNFFKIYDGKSTYYGGTQNWFVCNDLKRVGCSIVAAANIIAYYAIILKNKNIYNYEDMSKINFINHMKRIAEYIHPNVLTGVTSINYFNNKVIEFFYDKNIKAKSHKITTKNNFNDIKDFVKIALTQNKPLALLMLKNTVLEEFDWHWMTITKIFENGDKTYVDFSTWGERRIFTLENFYNFSSFGALSYFDIEI